MIGYVVKFTKFKPTIMKTIFCFIVMLLTYSVTFAQVSTPTAKDKVDLERTTKAIRDAFARGDVDAIVALHHPGIIKYFGGKNVVTGREELRKGLIQTFRNVKMEFVGNKIENTVFNGATAIETSIFTFKVTPKAGGKPTISSGRSMVVYVKYNGSPTGWASIREMAQAAP
jgi:ketosteroid isomerase-like protein